MSFFSTSALTVAVHKCPHEIDAVADRLPSQEESTAFKDACRAYDKDNANQLIENALKQYLKSAGLLLALENFCGKFAIKADFYRKSLPDMLLFIASHEAEISRKLNEKGII